MDETDAVCKRLQDDIKCADAQGCDIMRVGYLPGTGNGLANLEATCDGFNPPTSCPCSNLACKAIGRMYLESFNVAFTNQSYFNWNGFYHSGICSYDNCWDGPWKPFCENEYIQDPLVCMENGLSDYFALTAPPTTVLF